METGIFSTSLLALRLHLEGLFDGIGGARAVRMLDTLALLNEAEQAAVLSAFERTLLQVLEGSRTNRSEDELAEDEFVTALCDDICRELESPRCGNAHDGVSFTVHGKASKLEVIDGGKRTDRGSVVDLERARELRRAKGAKR
jgi:hypothetical protein